MNRIFKNCIRKRLIILVVCILFFPLCAESAKEESKQAVKVAFPYVPGWNETCPDGSRRGVVYEWLVEIAKYTGWEYEFIDTDNVNTALLKMYSGEYDLMGGMLKVPEIPEFNEKIFFPKYIMGFNEGVLLYNKDDEQIKSFDINTLDGKTVGVLGRANDKIKRLQNILAFNGLNCQLKKYDSVGVFEKALKNREVDLLLTSDIYATDDYNVALRFPSVPSYIVAQKSNTELCRQLEDAIEKIYAVNPNFGEGLFQKYFPAKYKNSTNYTEEELRFIQQSEPLKVAVVMEDNYPFYYFFHEQPKGIVPEIFQLISQNTGLQFEYVEAASYAEAIEMVKNGSADLLGDFINNSIAGNSTQLLISKNYVSLNSVILRHKDVNLLDSKLSKASIDGDTALSPQIGYSNIAHFKSYEDCLQAVDAGRADYTVMPMAVLEYLYMREYYANIIPVVDNSKLYLAIAMNKKADLNLYTVLTKGIVNIPEERLKAIVSGNTLAAGERKMSIKSLLYSNPVLFAVVIASFLGLLGILFWMRAWFRLQNKITCAKLRQAEEIGKVRSEFLSRMSHEIRTPLNAIIGFVNLMKLSGEGTDNIQKNVAKLDSSAKFLLSLVNDILDVAKLENRKMQLDHNPFAMKHLLKQLEDMFVTLAEEKQLTLAFECRLLHENFIGDAFRLKQVLTNLLSNACKFTEHGGTITVLVEEFCVKDQEIATAQLNFSVKDSGIGISKEDQERIFHSFEQIVYKSRTNQQGTGLGLAISYNLVKLMNSVLQVESETGRGATFYFSIEVPIYDKTLDEETEEYGPDGAQYELLRGKHILLAEDNELNAEIAMVLLQLQGAVVEWAKNGQEAVDKFTSAMAGGYDLILMDLQMPVKNGLEAAAEIRKVERTDAKTVPILAMTANTLMEDQENAFAAGMNGFIPKPFDVDQLYRSVEKFFR